MNDLTGQVAIVTGGARGIGLGISRVLRSEGANVLVADLDGDEAKAAAAGLSESGEHAVGVPADVTVLADLVAAAAVAVERWGRIDILAANAGVYPRIPLAEVTAEQWDSLLAINVRGALFAVQACLPQMQQQSYGRIVLTSSITGSIVGQPGYAVYGSTKAAMLGLMRSAALEVATQGITVNAVLPGNIRTPGFDDLGPEHDVRMAASIPLGMLGEPEDVGWAVRFLASAELATSRARPWSLMAARCCRRAHGLLIPTNAEPVVLPIGCRDGHTHLHHPDLPHAPLKESTVASSSDRLLTPKEVASVFRVDQKTVTKWATAGRIKGVRTPGGQWRFRESDVREALR